MSIRMYAQSEGGDGRAFMYEFKTEEEWQTLRRVLELEADDFSMAWDSFYRDMWGGTWYVKRYRDVT